VRGPPWAARTPTTPLLSGARRPVSDHKMLEGDDQVGRGRDVGGPPGVPRGRGAGRRCRGRAGGGRGEQFGRLPASRVGLRNGGGYTTGRCQRRLRAARLRQLGRAGRGGGGLQPAGAGGGLTGDSPVPFWTVRARFLAPVLAARRVVASFACLRGATAAAGGFGLHVWRRWPRPGGRAGALEARQAGEQGGSRRQPHKCNQGYPAREVFHNAFNIMRAPRSAVQSVFPRPSPESVRTPRLFRPAWAACHHGAYGKPCAAEPCQGSERRPRSE
jgi:hypothetical protein